MVEKRIFELSGDDFSVGADLFWGKVVEQDELFVEGRERVLEIVVKEIKSTEGFLNRLPLKQKGQEWNGYVC